MFPIPKAKNPCALRDLFKVDVELFANTVININQMTHVTSNNGKLIVPIIKTQFLGSRFGSATESWFARTWRERDSTNRSNWVNIAFFIYSNCNNYSNVLKYINNMSCIALIGCQYLLCLLFFLLLFCLLWNRSI